MKKIILLFLFLFTCSVANAELWVCIDEANKEVIKTIQGDGKKLGICDFNNTHIISNCILATKTEYEKAKQPYMKVDNSIINGDRVISMTQTEIDEKNKPTQAEIDYQKLLKDLKIKLKGMGFTDEEINILILNIP